MGELIPFVPVELLTSKDYYYDVYSYYQLHERLLKDDVRTWTYRNALFYNREKEIEGKVILDIGCGTGILSLLAAKCGAKRVIAIECSNIAQYAARIVKDNKLDHIITVIQGRVEDVKLPHGTIQVDAIVSEWMGHCLFSEAMLETLIFARDKWLKPGGTLFPDKCELFLSAVEDDSLYQRRIIWWKKVYGFDMSCLSKVQAREPIIKWVRHKQVVTTSTSLKKFDLHTIKKEDLNLTSQWTLKARRNDYIHCMLVYFTVSFSKVEKQYTLSTSPFKEYTHWRQTLFFLDEPITIYGGEKLHGLFRMKQNNAYRRDMDFKIRIELKGKAGDIKMSNEYQMH